MKVLFPQDARCIDIISALALLVISAESFMASMDTYSADHMQQLHFWAVVLFAISLLHIVSIMLYPVAETLRAIASGLSGLFWVYTFLSNSSSASLGALTIFVGLGCLYSAVLTVLYIGQRWKN